ncbi:MAG: asparagine synthase-related protein [Egibacteraceae bacterium]
MSGQAWFTVLPDCDAAQPAAEALRPYAPQVVPHPSGRPWLTGQWATGELVLADRGQVQVAVIGCCPVTATELFTVTRRVREISDLDRLGAELPGSFHLLATVGGRVRAQGSVSGLRRVFSARVGAVTVAADRADVVADLSGAGVDEQWLSARLLYWLVPHPLADQGPWRGVRAVPEGCYLLAERDGSDRVVRWWNPPEPSLPLAEGARIAGETLSDAVRGRTRASGTISCDLSGGLDSTSVCFLAARGGSRLVTVTVGGIDPDHDDVRWAERASRELDGVERLVFDPQELPLMFADVGQAGDGLDEPFAGARDRARFTSIARRLVERGSQLHFVGLGGDEVLQAPPSYLHTTARTHPRIAVNHVRGYRARRRWPLGATMRALADHRTYHAWLSTSADELTAHPPPREIPSLGWGPALRLPPWATSQAVDATRALLRQAAATAEPLAPTCGQHAALERVQFGARSVRHVVAFMACLGLPLAVPYLDDRVVEACLAVRLHERTTPWRYKPLIVEAMRGIVPAEVLARTTKGEFSVDWHAGLRRHRAHLADLLDDLALARLDIVDVDALRAACLGLYPPGVPMPALDRTLACEAWLRSLTHRTLPPGSERHDDPTAAR